MSARGVLADLQDRTRRLDCPASLEHARTSLALALAGGDLEAIRTALASGLAALALEHDPAPRDSLPDGAA